MKKTFLKAAIPTLAMLLVAVMALTGTTYAWFTLNDTATANGIDVTVTSAGGLLLSLDQSIWASEVNLAISSTNLNAVSTDGVLHDGIMKFWSAELSKTDNSKIASGSILPVTTAADNYLTRTLYIKNDKTSPVNVTFEGTNIQGEGKAAARLAVTTSAAVLITYADSDTTTQGLNGRNITVDSAVNPSGTVDYITSYSSVTSGTSKTFRLGANEVLQLEVYFWIDGQDPDCDNDIATKSISAAVQFKASAAS